MSEGDSLIDDTLLIVAAHPDDEVLGCGATLAWHADSGHRVEVLILSQGATSRSKADKIDSQEELAALQASAKAAAKILGTQQPRFAGLPDNRMDQEPLL